jgi:hypothetical protein
MRRASELLPWFFEGVYREEDLRSHLTAVKSLHDRRSEAYEHEHMYECLGILDAKAQALLAYDAILLTAASIVLSVFSDKVTPGTVLIAAALVASGISSALCLSVIWVHWTDTTDFSRAEDSFTKLLSIRNRRTVGYRLAWMIAEAATLLLIVGIPLQRIFG